MKKNIIISVLSIILGFVIILYAVYAYNTSNKSDMKFIAIKSEADLKKVLQKKETNNVLMRILTLPVSALQFNNYNYSIKNNGDKGMGFVTDSMSGVSANGLSENSFSGRPGTPSTDFSTTNIQVENVDEADTVKTDGLYIYSISGSSVIISSTDQEGKVEIVSKVTLTSVPEDILIYKNKLIVIGNLQGINNFSSR